MQEITCQQCGTVFTHKGGRGRRPTGCSAECKRLLKNKRTAEWREQGEHRRVNACKVCGATWCNRPGMGQKGPALFCSDRCRLRAQADAMAQRRIDDPDYIPAGKRIIECETCGDEYETSFKSTRFCSNRCRCAARSWVTLEVRRAVYERDKGICQLCREPVDMKLRGHQELMRASLDHIIPRSMGGSDEPRNLQLAHWACNSRKHTKAVGSQLRLI